MRVARRGLEHLDPGAQLRFVANHQSIYDIPIVFASLPYQLRIIAKESLGEIPFLGWHLRRGGHLLVDRRNPGRAGIIKKMARAGCGRAVADRLSRGHAQRRRHVARSRAGAFVLAD